MERQRDFAYLTDGLRIITENTAKYAGGSYLAARWLDLLKPPEPEDTRSGMEISMERLERMGFKVVEAPGD